MTKHLFFPTVLTLFASLQSGRTQPEKPPAIATNRYQLVSAAVPYETKTGTADEQALFLLDTQTGDVWRYQPTLSLKKNGEMVDQFPESFVMVLIDRHSGWDRVDAMKKFLKLNSVE